MKILNISAHFNGYNINVNNCLDYNIAGAASFFNKDFLKLYCSLWGIYANNKKHQHNIRDHTLNALGLKEIKINGVTNENIIYKIINELDLNHPVIFYTNNSALFYSSVYKENKINFLNHSFIINGYDCERKIFYIKENSVNVKVIDSLTKIRPFSEYQLTFEMINDIYKRTEEEIDIEYYSNNAIRSIEKVKEKSIINIFKRILNEWFYLLGFENDNLFLELQNVIDSRIFSSRFASEQFRRTNYYSLIPVFDLVEDKYNLKSNNIFLELKKNIMKMKENIINILAKNSFLKSKIKEDILIAYKNKMLKYNYELLNFLKHNIIMNKKLLDNEKNIIQMENVKIYSDSEDNFLKLENIREDATINDNFSFWKSHNIIGNHWIIIDFSTKQNIKKIKVEHHGNKVYTTVDFSIYKFNENDNWELIVNKKENFEINNTFNLDNCSTKKIKILITRSNQGIDYAARIKKIEVF